MIIAIDNTYKWLFSIQGICVQYLLNAYLTLGSEIASFFKIFYLLILS